MSSDKTLVNRIPHEDIASFSSWSLPSLGKGAKVVPSVKRDDNKSPDRRPAGKEIIEDVPDAQATQLTAEQLQTLTETAEKEAREEGYAKGYEEGLKKGEKKGTQLGEQKAYRETKKLLTEKMQTFETVADLLFQPATNQDQLLENSILDMAVQLAQHLLDTELSSRPELMFPLVEQAVSSLPAGAKNISVYLNETDLPIVQEAFAVKAGVWNFVADRAMARGGCKVESDASALDYSIERRLDDWQKAAVDASEAEINTVPEPEAWSEKAPSIASPQAETPGDSPMDDDDALSQHLEEQEEQHKHQPEGVAKTEEVQLEDSPSDELPANAPSPKEPEPAQSELEGALTPEDVETNIVNEEQAQSKPATQSQPATQPQPATEPKPDDNPSAS